MIWKRYKADQIHPDLNSLPRTFSQHQRHAEIQQDIYQHKTNWKIIGSIISLIIFVILLFVTIVGLPIILIKMKKVPICPTTTQWIISSTLSVQSSTTNTITSEE